MRRSISILVGLGLATIAFAFKPDRPAGAIGLGSRFVSGRQATDAGDGLHYDATVDLSPVMNLGGERGDVRFASVAVHFDSWRYLLGSFNSLEIVDADGSGEISVGGDLFSAADPGHREILDAIGISPGTRYVVTLKPKAPRTWRTVVDVATDLERGLETRDR